jgi:hypothetical protein
MFRSVRFRRIHPVLNKWDLYIYIWSKNFSHSAYEKSEAKMAAIDVQ